MIGLDKLFHKKLKKLLQPAPLLTRLLELQLRDIGIELTEKQKSDLKNQLKKLPPTSYLSFDFSDQQVQNTNFSEDELKSHIQDVLDNLPRKVNSVVSDIGSFIDRVISGFADSYAETFLKSIKEFQNIVLTKRREDETQFSNKIYRQWGEALDNLHIFVLVATDAFKSNICNSRKKKNYKHEALCRLSANALHASNEILILLKNGYADGAISRWRSLHEISVISSFLYDSDEETSKRYLDHIHVNEYKSAQQYQQYAARLNLEPLSSEDMKAIEKDCKRCIDIYGNEYISDYGWASQAMGKKKPNFYELEKRVSLDHIRPYYKFSSANIHTASKALYVRLGLSNRITSRFLVGQSSLGLIDPINYTSISLAQTITTLLINKPSIDHIVLCKTLWLLRVDIENAAAKANEQPKTQFQNS